MNSRIIVLTEGHTNSHTGKTAASVVRYRPDEVVALLDSTQAGRTSGELLGVGGDLPVVACIADARSADTLLLGVAPPGGRIPDGWRDIILDAISRGMNVVSGMHEFLSDDAEFAAAAQRYGVELTDVRKTDENQIAQRAGLRSDCLRVLTVGHDCSVGKMVTAIEISKALKDRGLSSKFVATGQTGIMIEGDGCPVDHVISDFVSGAVERMILRQQHHDILLIEGQGSLVHPSYSAVSLGLLHGAYPQVMILCYEVGRDRIAGLEAFAIPSLANIRELHETMASIHQPALVIGISMNSSKVSASEAELERQRIGKEFGLPVCDVIRDGPGELVDAVTAFRDGNHWHDQGK